jgi:hypothetical protein
MGQDHTQQLGCLLLAMPHQCAVHLVAIHMTTRLLLSVVGHQARAPDQHTHMALVWLRAGPRCPARRWFLST